MASSSSPAQSIKAITPGASVLSPTPRALYIAAGGTISVTNPDDTTAALVPVSTGAVLPIQPKKITAATATVYGLYGD